ncbi:nucleotidyltransferase domain-containing protein [Amycolatopsis rhabdoformis]|uniref:Nucleotidyltransferase domain-containing protein n=1 Tax=Amycolatopsis rhabdoformis TaxID=1448059 RepID=A0ABZ1IIP9_9PSEU|nr:nucleotidyltransferase domain-containing protein [Amycolatopsis rhabdoformis]WSE34272.1 nucleotidyltransferase domain-containing protein [Amycolatopsis rhabdoformis]
MILPAPHREFLDDMLPKIRRDPRVAGVAVGGSIAHGEPDEYSDVDILVVVDDDAFDAVLAERFALIDSWTDVLAAFTGEHVGEPRLVITLTGPLPLHVDFKFVRVADFGERTSDPKILWERAGSLTRALTTSPLDRAPLDEQWLEDRFWVWVHYAATKLGRGELFDVLGFLGFLRETVLGPLIAARAGVLPRGVRRLEFLAPAAARELQATVCGYDAKEAGAAVLASVELYRRWRGDVERRQRAEELAVRYLGEVLASAGD